MKVTNEKIEERQAHLKIEIEPEEIEKANDAAYKRLVKRVEVPGFRRGKAPRDIFERHVGKDRLFNEALDDLVPECYDKAIEQEKIDPIAQPHIDIETQEPLVLKAVVPLKPEVELGDYKTIDLKKTKVDIKDEAVDQVIERLQHQNATWEPADRAAEMSDMVSIDIDSNTNGESFIKRDNLEYHLADENGGPVPGFIGQLVGMKKDEEKEFTLKFPEEYFKKEFSGQDVTFKVKMNEIKKEVMPEINDDFAKSVNKDFESVKTLRENIKTELQARAEQDAKNDFENKVIEKAAELSKVEFPPVMVDVEVDRLLERNFRYLQQTGQDVQQYLKTIGKTIDDMREETKPMAKKRVAEALVLGTIAETEKVEVTQEDIDAEIDEMLATAQGDKEKLYQTLNEGDNRESIVNTLLTRKTIDLLVEMTDKGSSEETKEKKPAKKAPAKAKPKAKAKPAAEKETEGKKETKKEEK